MGKFSNWIQSPGTGGPGTKTGIANLGFVLSSQVPSILAKFVRVDQEQTFTPTEKLQGRTNIGLGEVDDTSDADKPVSIATQTALDLKANASTAVTLAGAQTLTNKTLTSPAINTPVGEFLRGHINGLILSNNSGDVVNDIDISPGSAGSDGTVPQLMVLGSVLTKRLDAAWSVGSGNGGLDTGTIGNNWYHVYVIRRSDTGVTDALFSLSATSPTLPTNYDQKRRVGAILRNAGSILAFTQNGDFFNWNSPLLDVNASNPGISATLRALSVPPGIAVLARLSVGFNSASGSTDNPTAVYLSPPSAVDIAPNFATAFTQNQIIQTAALQAATASCCDIFTNTSQQIRTRLSNSTAGLTFYISTRGWVDPRGKN